MEENTSIPSEFQALPLDTIVAAPLVAAINAQRASTLNMIEYLNSLLKEGDNGGNLTPITVKLSSKIADKDADGVTKIKEVNIEVPILAIVPIPHLRIDSVTTHFKYEIVSAEKNSISSDKFLNGEGALKKNPLFTFSLKGSLSSKSSSESLMNRNGVLEITVNASEAPIPEGLAKLLTLMSNAFIVEDKK
jgi:hypothetical protein